MKYQFQFAGAAASRAKVKAQPRLSKRTMLMGAAMLLLGGLACYQYFFRMAHTQHAAAAYTKAVAAVPAATAASAAAVPAAAPVAASAAEPVAALPTAVKQVADAGAQAIGNLVAEATKAPVTAVPVSSPVEAPASAVPVATATAVPVPTTMPFKIVPVPPVARSTRELTPQDKMTLAAQTALDNMLKLASSYPDAYGFGPLDVFEDAKLGEAIPVYTVAEKDRAAYKTGDSLKPVLTSARQWVYPVLSGDRICCMVQISSNGHEFIPGNASKSLALAWNKINELWPAADGYHPMLVVNPRIPGFYFSIPEADKPNITDTVQMFYINPSLSPADVILASWR